MLINQLHSFEYWRIRRYRAVIDAHEGANSMTTWHYNVQAKSQLHCKDRLDTSPPHTTMQILKMYCYVGCAVLELLDDNICASSIFLHIWTKFVERIWVKLATSIFIFMVMRHRRPPTCLLHSLVNPHRYCVVCVCLTKLFCSFFSQKKSTVLQFRNKTHGDHGIIICTVLESPRCSFPRFKRRPVHFNLTEDNNLFTPHLPSYSKQSRGTWTSNAEAFNYGSL